MVAFFVFFFSVAEFMCMEKIIAKLSIKTMKINSDRSVFSGSEQKIEGNIFFCKVMKNLKPNHGCQCFWVTQRNTERLIRTGQMISLRAIQFYHRSSILQCIKCIQQCFDWKWSKLAVNWMDLERNKTIVFNMLA